MQRKNLVKHSKNIGINFKTEDKMKHVTRQQYRELQAIEMQKYPMHLMTENQVNYTGSLIDIDLRKKVIIKPE